MTGSNSSGSNSSSSNNNNTPSMTADQRLNFLRSVAERNTIPSPSRFKRDVHHKKPSRRHKASRQLLSEETKRINTILQHEQELYDESVAAHEKDSTKPLYKKRVPKVTYFNIAAPPSLRPTKKYCDITGLKGPYQSPTNNIRYHNSEIYQLVVKPMAPGTDQEYLKLRGANFVLK